MFIQYDNLNISFVIDNIRFTTLNIAYEHIHRLIPSHSHGDNSFEIHYISSGNGYIKVGDKTYKITPNTLYMAGPHIAHAQISAPNDPMIDYCIYLRLKHRSDTTQSSTLTRAFEKQAFWIGQDKTGISATLESLFRELREQKEGYTILVESLLKQLIVQMVRNYDNDRKSSAHFCEATPAQAQDFIIEESFLYDYSTLTLKELSGRLGLGCRQTQRLIQETYGKTFLEKKKEARMSAASILLTHTDFSIASIAEELGYASPEHFATAFRQYFGQSAREYRKQNR